MVRVKVGEAQPVKVSVPGSDPIRAKSAAELIPIPGPPGDSAYQVAVDTGFEGTEEEWLASLVGPQGDPGSYIITATYAGDTLTCSATYAEVAAAILSGQVPVLKVRISDSDGEIQTLIHTWQRSSGPLPEIHFAGDGETTGAVEAWITSRNGWHYGVRPSPTASDVGAIPVPRDVYDGAIPYYDWENSTWESSDIRILLASSGADAEIIRIGNYSGEELFVIEADPADLLQRFSSNRKMFFMLEGEDETDLVTPFFSNPTTGETRFSQLAGATVRLFIFRPEMVAGNLFLVCHPASDYFRWDLDDLLQNEYPLTDAGKVLAVGSDGLVMPKQIGASDVGALPDTTKYAGSAAQGGAAKKTASIPMGQLDSTSTKTVMTAQVDGITELTSGVCMWLRNGVVTSASGFTINVNNLGAKPVYSSLAAESRSTTIFNVSYTCLFIFNADRVEGGCWDLVYGIDSNTTYSPYSLGFGYGTCTTAAATAAKAASISSSYKLVAGGYVTVKFSNDVPAGATLNVNGKGAKAMYYRGAAIPAGIIKAGDTVTFVYSTYYHIVAIIPASDEPVLPPVTAADDGKVLTVVNGVWTAV